MDKLTALGGDGSLPSLKRESSDAPRCGELIKPGEFWDLGHVDGSGKTLYLGPEHRGCNRATARHTRERDWSRRW
jgi:hypothetical protein